MSRRVLTPRVVVVGAGPSGLRAATDLAPRLGGEVLVLEREAVAGGIPRHCDHLGYGVRDLRRVTTGPRYAAALVRSAHEAGARILTSATVTGWAGERTLDVTTPDGLLRVEADAVVLATGARERPRSARLVPGTRALGVLTTGQLQNLVHLRHQRVGSRAVVVGGELVSWSAVLTLREAGCTSAVMVTEHERADSYAALGLVGRTALRTPVVTGARVVRILGSPTVTGVELEQVATGRRRVVECDTVVMTAGWIPDNELARAAGLELDAASLAPRVDASARTLRPGVFAVGNLVHPVDTADVAALGGAAAVPHVLAHLRGEAVEDPAYVDLRVEAPLRWVSPSRLAVDDDAPARGRLLLGAESYVRTPVVEVRQGSAVLARRRLPWPAAPGRVFRVPSSVLDDVDRTAGPVTLSLA
ncbi:MAG: FAD-dependent oxidoreductase [Candidatus Nanopelagicales bacterium]